MNTPVHDLDSLLPRLGELRGALAQAVVGQQEVVEQLLIGLLAGVWVLAVLVSAWVRTADRAGVEVLDVKAGDFGDVLFSGAPEMVALVAGVRTSLVIVVTNNNGGRIFEQLPLARRGEVAAPFAQRGMSTV